MINPYFQIAMQVCQVFDEKIAIICFGDNETQDTTL